ncbi:PDDEXK nuclease domain-containing protein [Chitinophaga tropicalis]|uniref:DUF1016 family protein n=1 Tax=Chitinophaga tropicalis TaxID=2683588 RepID=A0A7K1UDP2_9BACT|nr:PDDEXK nuclease domain-containing protein [Chitinophaga tropicalis]MVT12504.1 DUF1016 family protein [Chitinophaga tropicalis]
MENTQYQKIITVLKDNILTRRYNAARLVNREQLLLYYIVGKTLSEEIAAADWGAKVLSRISGDLQTGMPGLRGFSIANLEKMRQFYETYKDLQDVLIPSTVTREIGAASTPLLGLLQTSSTEAFLDVFLGLGFSHHYKLLSIKDLAARLFYMQQATKNQWSVRVLEYQISQNLYGKEGIQNNFVTTLPPALQPHALDAFKDEYLLDFINVNPQNERQLESEIVTNIKDFILSLGTGFIFIGNQYRLIVGDSEYFVDLLFFNRVLQCLVAFELKLEKFQPHHAGQLTFYLTALDDLKKLPHENPSIGIILCKEKDNKVVEYALRSVKNPMGVATVEYNTTVPDELKSVLPDPEDLKKLI